MKLLTNNGELTLPSDFSFEIEQNSAFFSEDGAASVAATIPATPQDKARLGFPSRVARKNRFINSIPASIQKGVFQKQGQLVIASSDDRSITCSMALEDSEFYSQHKDKNLKDIFFTRILTTYNTPAQWSAWLMSVYNGQVSFPGFRICPVAVNYNEESESYQVNNEPDKRSMTGSMYDLYHEQRMVEEGGKRITVPEGYGLAPFLPLHTFFSLLFAQLGYTVGYNCFESKPALSSLILLHNCSDVVCNGFIRYSDLVPNKTVSEILEWMNLKFHAQISVKPETMTVDILLLEDILSGHSDKDLTGAIIGSPKFAYSGSKRVTITPDASLDGAQPAAETISDIIAKYGGWVECNEQEFAQAHIGTCILRLSTGDFYEIQSSGNVVRIGSNYFKYDRKNADGIEDFAPEDLMPPMVYVNGFLMPYIGERKHCETSYKDSKTDTDQDIIIADYAGVSSDGRYNYATTQKYDDAGAIRAGKYNLNAEEMYFKFFKGYGDIILNNSIELSGEFNLTIEDIFKYNLYNLKQYNGQMILPTSLRYEVGRKIRCMEARFLIVKSFEDGVTDEPIETPETVLIWSFNNSELEEIEEGFPDPSTGIDRWYQWASGDQYQVLEPDIQHDPPAMRGQQTPHITRYIDIWEEDTRAGGVEPHIVGSMSFEQWWDAVAVAE